MKKVYNLALTKDPPYIYVTNFYTLYLLLSPSIYRVNARGHLNPTPINRVNNAISNTYRLTCKCHTFLETSRFTYLTIFRVNKRG